MNKSKNITKVKTPSKQTIAKNEIGLNQILKPALFLFISIILEIVSFSIFKFTNTSGSLQIFPTYILFDIGVWLIFCSFILCASKNWISNLIFYISLIIEVAIFITNFTLKNDFGYLFTVDMLRLLPEMTESIDVSFVNIKLIAICVVGAAIVIAIPILFDLIFKKTKITIKKITRPIFCLLCFLITATVGTGCFSAQTIFLKTSATNKELYDDKYLYENQQLTDVSYQKFGSCGFYVKNIFNALFKNSSTSKSQKQEAINLLTSSTVAENSSATLYGDNLIVIMLESFEWFAIDPYNTPNLWALKTGEPSANITNQAKIFTNYISNNKTNISEDLCLLGYMPHECIFTVNSANTYAAKYSLPNLFKSQGYSTAFFHNWKSNFYCRNTANINMGFENAYFLKDFSKEDKSSRFNFYNLENDFVNEFATKIAPTDQPFMSFYTTVATHGSYEVVNPQFKDSFDVYDANLENMKLWFEAEGYNYPTKPNREAILKEYKSAAIDTDNMVGTLFKHLNDTGLIHNTTVVLYADHNSYYHELTNEIKGTDKYDYQNQESHTVPFMIYSEKLTGGEVDTFCSPYELYPTISNLFGLPYNTLCAQGEDIFGTNIDNTIYMSYLTGHYNTKCYSKNMLDIKKYDGATDEDVENFKVKVNNFYKDLEILTRIYKSNYTY